MNEIWEWMDAIRHHLSHAVPDPISLDGKLFMALWFRELGEPLRRAVGQDVLDVWSTAGISERGEEVL